MYSVVQEEFDVIPVQSQDITDMQEGEVVGREDDGSDLTGQVSQLGGFSDGTLSFEGFSFATSSSSSIRDGRESEDTEKIKYQRIERKALGDDVAGISTLDGGLDISAEHEVSLTLNLSINATIVSATGTFVITKLLTIDQDYWQELFPSQDWWVVPAKVAFDQTIWSTIWNSVYLTVLGFLRLESLV
ncbi:hypothetical protein EZV62_004782 [Acer yangbiense]|uniref:Uncharacterized protein n=1 Tax=Acer yangbiense TaxID=1000413 RepID=A0A5C7IKB8_9ROSI|nr:hypothetical protein EZV62_004782 [Acer yangbiense]